MTSFAYRVLPPRDEFWDTIEPHELALMVRHLEHLRRLTEEETVRFVGRAENGDYGFVLIEADGRIHASVIARGDPAVSEGLMRLELHPFVVVFDAVTTRQQDSASL